MSDRTCSVASCERPAWARGWCGTHYRRWKRTGDVNWQPPTREQKFWALVKPLGDCLEWQGWRAGGGHRLPYGMTEINGKSIPAHRAAWIFTHGEIPPGMIVCHRCDNPPCVKPDHLFLGTPADNTADMYAKGRSRYQTTGRGHKLCWSDVDAIRSELESGVMLKDVAAKYGLSLAYTWRIRKNLAWDPARRQ